MLAAAAKAQAAKLARLAAAVPAGREAEAAWCDAAVRDDNDPRWTSETSAFVRRFASRQFAVRISLPFVCAALGHVDELEAVLDAPSWTGPAPSGSGAAGPA
ncbi:hypothetical protein Pelo_15449 [Pelomyxa schiedti]|nr:hypothetical protein Pelo_15449 [Pelomyxa schiedti]